MRQARKPSAPPAYDERRMARPLTLLMCALATAAALAAGTSSAQAAGSFQGTLAVTPPQAPTSATTPVTVTATVSVAQQCDATTGCAYQPFVTTVATTSTCQPVLTSAGWRGPVLDDATGAQPLQATAQWQERPWIYAGPKRACLYVVVNGAATLLAETAYNVPSAPTTPPAKPDPKGRDLNRAAIPRAVGVRRGYPYTLSTANVPRAVGAKRYAVIARVAAKRWGLKLAGTTTRTTRTGDRRDTVGFAKDVPSVALGVTRIRTVRYYRRENGRTRVVGERVVERDLSLAVNVPWWVGPGPPPADQVDLQTVIVHELGHYAGNGHVPNCTNSPMWTGLAPGEWWYGPKDWFQFGCSNAPGARATTARAAAVHPAPHGRCWCSGPWCAESCCLRSARPRRPPARPSPAAPRRARGRRPRSPGRSGRGRPACRAPPVRASRQPTAS